MKIILATPLYPPEIEPLAVYVQELAQRLQTTHSLTVVAYADQAEKISGLKLLTVNKHEPLLIRIIKYTILLWRASAEAELIYAQNAVACGLPSILVKYWRGLPVIINFAEDEAWKRARYFGQSRQTLDEFLKRPLANLRIRTILNIQGWVLRRATAVTVSSQALASAISQGYRVPLRKITVIYPAPEKTEILPLEIVPVPHQIITGSTLGDNNLSSIIRAVAIVKNNFPDIRLLVTGNITNKAKLEKLIIELGLSKNVELLGQISRAESWYRCLSSTIYFEASFNNYFSSVIWENFLADLPTISAENTLSAELLGDQTRGILIKNIDERKLAENFFLLFTDQIIGAKISANVKIFLGQEFSWPKHLRRLNSLFESLIK